MKADRITLLWWSLVVCRNKCSNDFPTVLSRLPVIEGQRFAVRTAYSR